MKVVFTAIESMILLDDFPVDNSEFFPLLYNVCLIDIMAERLYLIVRINDCVKVVLLRALECGLDVISNIIAIIQVLTSWEHVFELLLWLLTVSFLVQEGLVHVFVPYIIVVLHTHHLVVQLIYFMFGI